MNVLPVAPAPPPPPKINEPAASDEQFSDLLSDVRKDSTDEARDADRPTADRDRRPEAKTGDDTSADTRPEQTRADDVPAQGEDQGQAPSTPKSEAAAGKPEQPAATVEAATTTAPNAAPTAASVPNTGSPNGADIPAAAAAKSAGAKTADAGSMPATGQAEAALTPSASNTKGRNPNAGQSEPKTSVKPGASAPATVPQPAMPTTDAEPARPTATAAPPSPPTTTAGTSTATVPAFAGAPTGNAATSTTPAQPNMPQNTATTTGQAELPQVQNLARAELLASTTNGTAQAMASQTVEASHGGGTIPTAGIGAATSAESAGGSQSTATAASPSRPAANMQAPTMQVAVQIARAAQDGVNQIQVRLNPAELGRVDVKMDVGHDGRVIAVVTADRQETLDLLQRDQRGLERALQDAGLQTGSGGLSFSLRHDGADGQPTNTAGGGAGADAEPDSGDTDPAGAPRAARPDGLLDISV